MTLGRVEINMINQKKKIMATKNAKNPSFIATKILNLNFKGINIVAAMITNVKIGYCHQNFL